MNKPHSNSPRVRLKQLLAIPERQRTEEEWDELNELEMMGQDLLANIWQTNQMVVIDPESGRVKGRVDLTGLLRMSDRNDSTDVLNGIAWDSERDRLFVTGKLWPKLFEIRLKPVD